MSPSMIRRKVEEEIARVPDESIAKLYDMVHHFRLQSRMTGNAEKIISLAGSWADMPEEEYESFLGETEERRRRAGTGRRIHGTGFD